MWLYKKSNIIPTSKNIVPLLCGRTFDEILYLFLIIIYYVYENHTICSPHFSSKGNSLEGWTDHQVHHIYELFYILRINILYFLI